jgi:hypothetical protein
MAILVYVGVDTQLVLVPRTANHLLFLFQNAKCDVTPFRTDHRCKFGSLRVRDNAAHLT